MERGDSVRVTDKHPNPLMRGKVGEYQYQQETNHKYHAVRFERGFYLLTDEEVEKNDD